MRHTLPTLAAIGLAVLSSAALSVAAPQVQAQPDLLVCNGMQTVNYDPPITNVPLETTADITESYSPCLTPSDPGLTSGDGFGAGSAATREVILPQLDVTACDGMGVAQENGTATLTFA